MRETPALETTPVLFSAATYHEREARTLAQQCGVRDVVSTSSTPQAIFAAVDAALGAKRADAASDVRALAAGHLRLVNSPLAVRIDRSEASKQQMAAILDVTLQIAAERDPNAIITKLCAEARRATLARVAVMGLLTGNDAAGTAIFTSGIDEQIAVGIAPPDIAGVVLDTVIRERRAVRSRHLDGQADALLGPRGAPVSLLSVPIASPTGIYGWLSLRNKVGADEFSEADERAAMALASHAGIAYANTQALDLLRHRVAVLEASASHESSSRTIIRS
jgi:GAF domain-containing protein